MRCVLPRAFDLCGCCLWPKLQAAGAPGPLSHVHPDVLHKVLTQISLCQNPTLPILWILIPAFKKGRVRCGKVGEAVILSCFFAWAKKKTLLLKAKGSKLLLCNWGLNNGSFLFPKAKCILWWSLLTCFKKPFVHTVVDEKPELAFFVFASSFKLKQEAWGVFTPGESTGQQTAWAAGSQSQDICPAALMALGPTAGCQLWILCELKLLLGVRRAPTCVRGANPRYKAFKKEQKRFKPCFNVFGDK